MPGAQSPKTWRVAPQCLLRLGPKISREGRSSKQGTFVSARLRDDSFVHRWLTASQGERGRVAVVGLLAPLQRSHSRARAVRAAFSSACCACAIEHRGHGGRRPHADAAGLGARR